MVVLPSLPDPRAVALLPLTRLLPSPSLPIQAVPPSTPSVDEDRVSTSGPHMGLNGARLWNGVREQIGQRKKPGWPKPLGRSKAADLKNTPSNHSS